MTSIRRRTSLLVAASMGCVLALGGVALFVVVRAALTRQFDDGLASRAAALQSLTRLDRGVVEMDIAGEVMPRYQAGENAEYFAAWVRDGCVLGQGLMGGTLSLDPDGMTEVPASQGLQARRVGDADQVTLRKHDSNSA